MNLETLFNIWKWSCLFAGLMLVLGTLFSQVGLYLLAAALSWGLFLAVLIILIFPGLRARYLMEDK